MLFIYTDNFHDLYGRFNAAVFADIDGNEPLSMSHTWVGTGKHTFTPEPAATHRPI